jgi:hypothetical protein
VLRLDGRLVASVSLLDFMRIVPEGVTAVDISETSTSSYNLLIHDASAQVIDQLRPALRATSLVDMHGIEAAMPGDREENLLSKRRIVIKRPNRHGHSLHSSDDEVCKKYHAHYRPNLPCNMTKRSLRNARITDLDQA